MAYPPPDQPGLHVFTSIVGAFLSCAGGSSSDSGKFRWEDHYKLKYVCVVYRTWELASEFGKPEKGKLKAEMLKSYGDGGREERCSVMYKAAPSKYSHSLHAWQDYGFAWVERVEKDIA
jgi:hypothetical protein